MSKKSQEKRRKQREKMREQYAQATHEILTSAFTPELLAYLAALDPLTSALRLMMAKRYDAEANAANVPLAWRVQQITRIARGDSPLPWRSHIKDFKRAQPRELPLHHRRWTRERDR